METLGNNIVAKNCDYKYHCIACNYKCFKKYNWDKHILSGKHLKETQTAILESGNGKQWQYQCENCNKLYQNRSGLWKHKQKCNLQQKYALTKDNEPTDKELIMMLIKENSELKTMMMKVIENGTINTNNSHNTTTNSHNKAFNLQFFLNETCKNAMNITDFVDSIKLQLSDFMSMGEVGFIEGISNIIVKNLNSLDETVRPIHCTDQKRETFYVKDANIW